MTQYSADQENRLREAVEKMPAFPKSVQKIIELTRDINCDPKDLVAVIEKDPVMTVKILRVLNSAYYSTPRKITSMHHSIVFLGFNTIKHLALSIASLGILPKRNIAGFDINQYQLHSLAVAGIAKLLCSRAGTGDDPMDYYIAGLLHDFGKVVLAQFMPDEFRSAQNLSREQNIPLSEAERLTFGTDHAAIGAMLAEKWQFPETLIHCIRDHHHIENDSSVMLACIYAADQISKRIAGVDCYTADKPLPPAVENICSGSIDELIASMGDLPRIMDEAALFVQVESDT